MNDIVEKKMKQKNISPKLNTDFCSRAVTITISYKMTIKQVKTKKFE